MPTQRRAGSAPDKGRPAIDRLRQRCGMVCHRHRRPAFETGLPHAAFVVRPALAAVFIAQMNFHPGDRLAEVRQRLLNRGTDLYSQRLGAMDVGVGVELDLHGVLRWGQ